MVFCEIRGLCYAHDAGRFLGTQVQELYFPDIFFNQLSSLVRLHALQKGRKRKLTTDSFFCRSSWICSSDAGFVCLQVHSPGMFLVGFSSFIRNILVMRGIPIKAIITLTTQVIPQPLNTDSCQTTENIAVPLQNSSTEGFFFLTLAFKRAYNTQPLWGSEQKAF